MKLTLKGIAKLFDAFARVTIVKKSGCHFLGVVGPQAECISPCMSV
jgi:hypothetical protein